MTVTDIAAFGASSSLGAFGGASNRPDRHVQSAFSAVLEEAGREGYASAKPLASGESVAESAQKALDDWFGSERNGRYATKESLEELQQAFGQIVVRAMDEGGYVDPKGFLAGLSRDELSTLQSVNSLAEPINVGGLTEEGALNLLLPPAAQVDLNHDGITQSGVGNGLRFPNSDTPAEVVEAWDAATAGMSPGAMMAFELRMMLPLLTANIEVDDNGQFVRHYEPGDPGWRNPFNEAGYSYRDAVQSMIDALDFQKEQTPIDQYEEQMAFWRRFGEELAANGAT
ncbi:hypothetical protein Pla108_08430 [Botrimarina colliarenosi]|uniref:Uncharacterized protein n=1 Tax=Botrimarina colliarenosi TaxID=2528001 RepID=A0A5C6AKH1_9BACT|nr:hypothetical protein [Botrimarina colliarenosi]TWT99900.1 hypothetical protein Pla108_08430 [Botrimarina colliarenosi]